METKYTSLLSLSERLNEELTEKTESIQVLESNYKSQVHVTEEEFHRLAAAEAAAGALKEENSRMIKGLKKAMEGK